MSDEIGSFQPVAIDDADEYATVDPGYFEPDRSLPEQNAAEHAPTR